MYNVINNTYSNCFLNCLSKNEFEKIISKDKALEYVMKNKVYTIQLFSENLEFATKMIRFYMQFLKRQTDIKECTYNKYKYDIENVIGIYNRKYKKNGMDEDLIYEENAINFFNMAEYKIKRYIKKNFKFKNDREEFINYICSISYAYLKNLLNTYDDEVLDEEIEFMNVIENSNSLYKLFEDNDKFFTVLMETLSSCLLEYRQSCDIRNKLNDKESINVFKKLDKNFDTKYMDNTVIEDYTIDILFERVMNTFLNELNNDQIFDLLTDEISIYKDLFFNGLDPRFEKRYKFLIMRKLIVNSYEYLLYLYKINDPRIDTTKDLKDIKLPIKDDSVLSFFCNNYNNILNMYREFANKTINYYEKIRIDIYNDYKDSLIKMKKTYFYIEGRYLGIIYGMVKKLDSVDYLNDIYLKIKRDKFLELNGIEEVEKYFKTICYYVYERIINIKDCSNNVKVEIEELIKDIGSIDNFSEEFIKNKEKLQKVTFWFASLSINEVSYFEEIRLRKKIHNPEHIKVLNRLNEFNENIKN